MADEKFTEYKFPDETEQEVEVKADASDTEIEVVDDTPEGDKNRKPLDREVVEPTEEELKEYSDKVQARIKELTHARHDARRQKEAIEREHQELTRFAQKLIEDQKELKKQLAERQTYGATQTEKLAEKELEQAKIAMKQAHEAGDTDAFVEANERMAAATLALERARAMKQNTPLRDSQESSTVDDERAERPSVRPKPDAKAERWKEKNTWFGVDEEMTAFALGLHNKLVKNGMNPTSDEYYRSIDTRLRQIFPDAFKDGDEEQANSAATSTRKPATVVAPVSRSTSPKKIRLTQTQVALAKRMGIPIEVYAREAAALEKGNG